MLDKQLELQDALCELRRSSVHPLAVRTQGQFVQYVRSMQQFMNREIEELLLELPASVQKPWSAQYETDCAKPLELTDSMREEAIDALCFMMNVLLVCRIDDEQLAELYNKVYDKNIGRLNGAISRR